MQNFSAIVNYPSTHTAFNPSAKQQKRQKHSHKKKTWNCYKLIAVNYYILLNVSWWCERMMTTTSIMIMKMKIDSRKMCWCCRIAEFHVYETSWVLEWADYHRWNSKSRKDWINQLKRQIVWCLEIIRLFKVYIVSHSLATHSLLLMAESQLLTVRHVLIIVSFAFKSEWEKLELTQEWNFNSVTTFFSCFSQVCLVEWLA